MKGLQFITQQVAYAPEVQAVFAMAGSSAADIFDSTDTPVVIDGKRIAPWGPDNDLPNKIMEKIRANDVVSPNLLFNVQTGYAQGIKPMRRIREGDKVYYVEAYDDRIEEFFENNDVDGFFLEQVSDMMTFFNVFPEIILSKDGKRITGLRHLEAIYSRWGAMTGNDKEIQRHYYAEWQAGSPKNGRLDVTRVLSRYNTVDHLRGLMASGCRDRRFVLQVSMPTPGRTYYAFPYWWSIFRSGWYDLSKMLPAFKKALLTNHLSVRYIVYISDEFWVEVFHRDNVDDADEEKKKEVMDREIGRIMEFLSGNNAKGGGLISTKKNVPLGGSKPFEDRFVQIEVLKPGIEGGEFIEDAEEASNMISYAMGVHPNLNGATPGKSKGSLGGSDKRELFNIKQAMMRPFRDRLLKPLTLIKRYNGWDKDIVFAVPEHIFTTLDESKTGTKTRDNA